MLRLRHLFSGHGWRAASLVFNPPAGRVLGYPANDLERKAQWGFTTLVLTCECGKLRTVELIGDHRANLIARIQTYGENSRRPA